MRRPAPRSTPRSRRARATEAAKASIADTAVPSLPGYAPPTVAPEDPLAIIGREQLLRKANKRGMRVAPVQTAEGTE